jgi:hypothetical protein
MDEHKIPAGHTDWQAMQTELNKLIKDKYGIDQG